MYIIAQANIYITKDNKDILITHIIENRDNLSDIVKKYQTDYPQFSLYLDNYEKLFAQSQELIQVPKDQNTDRFLEFVYILSLKKTHHRVITFFLLKAQQQSYILNSLPQVMDAKLFQQNEQYSQQQFNQTIIPLNLQYLQELNKDLKNVTIDNKSITEYKIYSLGFIESEDSYQISYTHQNYIGILTSFQVNQVSFVEKIHNKEEYNHININSQVVTKPWNIRNKCYCIVKITQISQLLNSLKENKQLILILNNKIPAIQFPLSQEKGK